MNEDLKKIYETYLFHLDIFNRYQNKDFFVNENIFKNMEKINYKLLMKLKIYKTIDYESD